MFFLFVDSRPLKKNVLTSEAIPALSHLVKSKNIQQTVEGSGGSPVDIVFLGKFMVSMA